MDWKDIGAKVATLAPQLGQILGDALPIPFGGSLGRWAGEYLADQLGVAPTPEAVSAALDTKSPAVVAAALSKTEGEAVARWNAMAEMAKAQAEVGKAQVEAVNETIRAETSAKVAEGDGWLGKWRGIHAWELTLECPFWAGCIIYSVTVGSGTAVNELAQASGIIMTYWAARFGVLGVHVWQGSNERQAALTGSPVDAVKNAVKIATGKK